MTALTILVIAVALVSALVDTIETGRVYLFSSVHPGAALVVGPILIGGPYARSRALSNRAARRFGGKGKTG